MIRFLSKFRSLFLNLYYFKRYKHVYFGKNVTIKGECVISNDVSLCHNVEVRSNKSNIFIGACSSINRNSLVIGKVIIKEYVAISPNCVIVGSNHVFKDPNKLINDQGVKSKGIYIDDDVWIGANSTVLDGVVIGKGSIIGAGSVVSKSIPPYSVAFGNPCIVVKKR